MSEHSKYGASGAHRWMNCPASVGLALKYPQPEEPSQAATEGTTAHKLLELSLANNMTPSSFLYSGVIVGTRKHAITVEMVDAVTVAYNFIKQLKEENHKSITYLEQRVDISNICGSEMFGTADVIMCEPWENISVIDYKNGKGVPVYAENNPQLKYYALGAVNSGFYDIGAINAYIIQPRCERVSDIQKVTYEHSDLMQFAEELKIARLKADEAEAHIFNTGAPRDKDISIGSWCQFCPARISCPAHFKMFDKAQEARKNDLDINGNIEKLTEILKYGDEVKNFINLAQSHCVELAKRGQTFKGFQLEEKRSVSAYNVPHDEIINNLCDSGYSIKDITRTTLKPLTELKKVCGADVIEPFTAKKSTGVALKPVDPSKKPNGATAFNDFEPYKET